MGAREFSADEERIYKLLPLPDVPFCGREEAARLNRAYEAQRGGHRVENDIPAHDSGTRTAK
jgi:hypothetical protein